MIRRPPRSTQSRSSAASDVYKRQVLRSEWEAAPQAVVATIGGRLGFPLFVKPANLGSSVGISKVKTVADLGSAITFAAEFDRKIVVETAVPAAREIECSVLGNDRPEASVPGEIVPSRAVSY